MEQLRKEEQILGQFLNTEGGKQALELLKDQFYNLSRYTKGDPYDTTYRVGQQDVINYLISIAETYKGESDGVGRVITGKH